MKTDTLFKYNCTGYIDAKGFGGFLENNLKEPRYNINIFTEELKKLFKIKYLSLVNSGSSANLVSAIMLRELEPKKKKVILSTFSFPTTISAFKLLDFEVILCDIEKDGFNIDANILESLINDDIAAIVITHFLGFPTNLNKVSHLCKKNNILLIQDACETMHLEVESNSIYSYGDIVTHSFYHPHHLSSYGGGAVIVNNQKLFLLADSIIHWGRGCTCHFDKEMCKLPQGLNHNFSYKRMGINVEISELNACFGRFQLINWENEEKVRNNRYDILFTLFNQFDFLKVYPNNANISPFVFPITLSNNDIYTKFIELMNENSIEVRSLMGGAMYNQEAFRDLNIHDFPNSDFLTESSIFIGIHQTISDNQFSEMLEIIKKILHKIKIDIWQKFVLKYPHEFTIQYPQDPKYFQLNYKSTAPLNLKYIFKNKKFNLYLHIPFCESKCTFCNFAVDTRKSKYEIYTKSLLLEIEQYKDIMTYESILSIDIGGGTPMQLPINLLNLILEKIQFLIKDRNNNYASIETTPKIASEDFEKLRMIFNYGIRRISLGIQTSDNNTLNFINRKKQLNLNKKAISNIYKVGFERVNIDLIFALPNQTKEIFIQDLEEAISLNPTSITIYDCLYSREGRHFHKSISLPTMEKYGELYDIGYRLLIGNNYYGNYGSVNFSKFQDETGTSLYFENRILHGKSYLGLGNYVTSMDENIWSFNQEIDSYIESTINNSSVIGDFYKLDATEVMAKHILNNLNYGYIDINIFYNKFNKKLEDIYKYELLYALNKNWILKRKKGFYLKFGNFKNLNYLRSLFYTNGMKKFMLNKEKQC